MKVKKIKVKIQPLSDALDEFVSVANAVKSNKKVKANNGVFFADPETVRSLFTESRINLIKVIKKEKPESIYALAKMVNRDFKNVYEDVFFLKEIGVVEILESSDKRKKSKPIVVCQELLFDLVA